MISTISPLAPSMRAYADTAPADDHDLPPDFDKSFESSMSISDSLEHIHAHHSRPRSSSPPPALLSRSAFDRHNNEDDDDDDEPWRKPPSKKQQQHNPYQREVQQLLASTRPSRSIAGGSGSTTSPARPLSLGAALGTSLNRHSPNLAAKGMTSRFSPPTKPNNQQQQHSKASAGLAFLHHRQQQHFQHNHSAASSPVERTPTLESSATCSPATCSPALSDSSSISADSVFNSAKLASAPFPGAAAALPQQQDNGAIFSPLGRQFGTDLSLNDGPYRHQQQQAKRHQQQQQEYDASAQTPTAAKSVLAGPPPPAAAAAAAMHAAQQLFGPASGVSNIAAASGLGIIMHPPQPQRPSKSSGGPPPPTHQLGPAAMLVRPPLLATASTSSAMSTGGARIRGRAARDDHSSSPGYDSPTREPPMKKRPSIVGLRRPSVVGAGPGGMGMGGVKPALRPAGGMLGQRPMLQKSATLSAASAAAEFHALRRPPAVHFVSLPSRAGKLSAGPALGGSGSSTPSDTFGPSPAPAPAPAAAGFPFGGRPIRGLGKRSLSLAAGAGAGLAPAGSVFGPARPVPMPLQSAGPFSTTFPENVIAAHELPTAGGGRIPKSSSGPIPTMLLLEDEFAGVPAAAAPAPVGVGMVKAGSSGSERSVRRSGSATVSVQSSPSDTSMAAAGDSSMGRLGSSSSTSGGGGGGGAGQPALLGDDAGDFSDFFNNPQSPEVSFSAGSGASHVLHGGRPAGGSLGRGSLRSRSSSSAAALGNDVLADISGCSLLDGPARIDVGPSADPDTSAAVIATADGNQLRRNKDRRMPSLIAAFAGPAAGAAGSSTAAAAGAGDRSVAESDRSSSSPLSSPSQGRQLGGALPPSLLGSVAGPSTNTPPAGARGRSGSRVQVLSQGGGGGAAASSSSLAVPTSVTSPGAVAMDTSHSSSSSSPGFGFGEAVERFTLPSVTGTADRLQRLTPETMIQLLSGGFDDVVGSYTVIDCRYSYEYAGGHIPGAVNLRTVDEIKAYLLTPGRGLNAGSAVLPPRTTAGGRRGSSSGGGAPVPPKHVLVFHCEYSQKRAPRMAAALRDLDRSLAQDWPRCHYPELYILNGGYERFFRQYPAMCDPPRQYVGERDARFEREWKAESRVFVREFSRVKSMPVPRRLQRRLSESAAPAGGERVMMMMMGGGEEEEAAAAQQQQAQQGRRVNGGGVGDVSGSVGDDSQVSSTDDTPSRPPLVRIAGLSASDTIISKGSSSSCSTLSTAAATKQQQQQQQAGPLANRTNVLGAGGPGAASGPRFGSRAPGMGPRAATASYVPMLCSGGSAMIREASREGDHLFSP